MRKPLFRDEQIVRILQEAGRDQIAVLAMRRGISEASTCVWRKRFVNMGTDQPSPKKLRIFKLE